jgi:NAD(P)-dependent dehydrogenase (short-subunit alcohol dehydrogenase family)
MASSSSPRSTQVADCVALVTGGNRGIGQAFVEELLAGGARKVYCGARNVDDVPGFMRDAGVVPVPLDITDVDSVAAAAAACPDVTVLVNNAGFHGRERLVLTEQPDVARQEMEVNYFGTLNMIRAFAPVLGGNGGGAIVNVLSALSWVSMPASSTYCASKSAAWSLSNGLRHELRGQGTQVLSLHVGFMDTDMVRHVTAPKSKPEEVVVQTLAALEAGKSEILADDVSRRIKQHLSDDPGVYLVP